MTEYHCLGCKEYFEVDAALPAPAACPKCACTHVAPVTLITGPAWFNAQNGIRLLCAGVGALLLGTGGGYVGFLRRPALEGTRLPFMTVLTRGTSLPEVDQGLVPLAQSSFYYLLMGVAAGVAAGAIVGLLIAPLFIAQHETGTPLAGK